MHAQTLQRAWAALDPFLIVVCFILLLAPGNKVNLTYRLDHSESYRYALNKQNNCSDQIIQ